MEKLTQITQAWELFEQGVPKSRIATHLGRNRETVIGWIQAIQQHGLTAYLELHPQANQRPRPARQVRTTTKQLIWAIREREGFIGVRRLLRAEDCLLPGKGASDQTIGSQDL